MSIKNRIFVVGCPRSGTTMVQTLLMSAGLLSFPETHYFNRVNTTVGRVFRGIYAEYILARWSFDNKLAIKYIPKPVFNISRSIENYVSYLDSLALEAGASGWVEKTPWHLHSLSLMVDHPSLRGAKYVHVLRNPVDTVQSLVKASKLWSGSSENGMSVEVALRNWLSCYAVSVSFIGNESHYLFNYDYALVNTQSAVGNLAEFCEIPSSAFEMDKLNELASKVIQKDEVWKENNKRLKRVNNLELSKNCDLLSKRDVQRMLEVLVYIDKDNIYDIAISRLDRR